MKSLIFIIALLSSLPCYGVEVDKAAHFGLAFAGQTVCAEIAEEISDEKVLSELGCFIAVNTVGVVKELTDPSRGGNRELADIGANLLGSGLSIGVRLEW